MHNQHLTSSNNLNSLFKPLQSIIDLLNLDADTILTIYKNPTQNPEIDQNIVKSVMKLRGKTEKKLKIKK